MIIVVYNINKEIIKGISCFFIRDFFLDDVSLFLFWILYIVVFDLFFCDLSLCWLLKLCNGREGWNLVMLVVKWFRNGRDEDLWI